MVLCWDELCVFATVVRVGSFGNRIIGWRQHREEEAFVLWCGVATGLTGGRDSHSDRARQDRAIECLSVVVIVGVAEF